MGISADALLLELRSSRTDLARLVEAVSRDQFTKLVVPQQSVDAWEQREPETCGRSAPAGRAGSPGPPRTVPRPRSSLLPAPTTCGRARAAVLTPGARGPPVSREPDPGHRRSACPGAHPPAGATRGSSPNTRAGSTWPWPRQRGSVDRHRTFLPRSQVSSRSAVGPGVAMSSPHVSRTGGSAGPHRWCPGAVGALDLQSQTNEAGGWPRGGAISGPAAPGSARLLGLRLLVIRNWGPRSRTRQRASHALT